MLNELPCVKCPVFIMCKNKLHAKPVPLFTICKTLEEHLFKYDGISNYNRIIAARSFFGLEALYTRLQKAKGISNA